MNCCAARRPRHGELEGRHLPSWMSRHPRRPPLRRPQPRRRCTRKHGAARIALRKRALWSAVAAVTKPPERDSRPRIPIRRPHASFGRARGAAMLRCRSLARHACTPASSKRAAAPKRCSTSATHESSVRTHASPPHQVAMLEKPLREVTRHLARDSSAMSTYVSHTSDADGDPLDQCATGEEGPTTPCRKPSRMDSLKTRGEKTEVRDWSFPQKI